MKKSQALAHQICGDLVPSVTFVGGFLLFYLREPGDSRTDTCFPKIALDGISPRETAYNHY